VHVLVVNNIYPPIMAGGAELIVAFLCEGLAERGHRVTVISTCGPEMEPYPVEHRNGVEIIRFFPPNRYWSFARGKQGRQGGVRGAVDTARWHVKDAWNRDAGRRVAAIYAGKRPDVLHTHLIDGLSATVWRRAKARGVPVVHTAHDYHLLCPRAFLLSRSWQICHHPTIACRMFRAWHLQTTRDVDLFASPSQFLLDLHQRAGLHSRAAAVVPNGIPLPRIARTPRGGPRNRFLLLARLTVEKGIRVVLDAMSRLSSDRAIELTIGGRGPLENEVRAAAAKDPRIRFLGYVAGDAKAAAFAYADHMLLPSLWYENAPTVILEAAANGLWLIASRIGGIPEFLREGKTGELFPPGDAGALAVAMEAATRDNGPAVAVQTHGDALVQDFTVPRMVDAYLGHYDSLLRRSA
jgi:glycosyltransferase involved in cell wall biosynthesis